MIRFGHLHDGNLEIAIAGGDTAKSLNLSKRVAIVARAAGGLDGKRVLDCGCGAGAYAMAYAELGARVVGIEYEREKLRSAVRRAHTTASFAIGDLEHLPLRDSRFDVAVLNEVLEHVPDDARALAETRRVLRPGGVLVVMSPNRLYPFESHGVALRGRERLLPVYLPFVPYLPLPLGRLVFDYWARNYWPWQLRDLLRRTGFQIVQTGYVAQTFENITGKQPEAMRLASPLLRATAAAAERVPIANALCSVSQLVIAHKT